MDKSKLISAALVALGLLALGLTIRSGLRSITDNQRNVEVRGLATRQVEANRVTWPVMFTHTGNDLPQLYDRVASTNNAIVKFLTDNGIPSQDISVGAPDMTDLSTNRYNSDPLPYNYSMTSVVTVSSSQVDKVRSLIGRQGELLKQGIPILAGDWQHQITYEYTDLNSIKPAMIQEATRNAREAAQKFAEDSESKLGKIINASQGQFTIEDRDSYTPYIKEVRVVTSLTYSLED